jgi:hypothetical protein
VQLSSSATCPQIVRISYAEGDVRQSRGKKAASWETASPGASFPTDAALIA